MIIENTSLQREAGARGLPVRVHRVRFGSQAEQVFFLRQIVNVYRRRPSWRKYCIDRTFGELGCVPKQYARQARAVGQLVKDQIVYVPEIDETFQFPPLTIRLGYGDCDDFNTLIGAWLEALGIPVELVAMHVRPKAPTAFREWWLATFGKARLSHIWPRALIRRPFGRWARFNLDATLRNHPIGTDPIRLALERGDFVRTIVA